MGAATQIPAVPAVSPEPLAGNLAWLLSQASHALVTQQTAALEALGISPRGYCVLATAMTRDFTQTDLADTVGLDKTTMVVTIDELERTGLAERRPSATDRRARVIAVTKAGERKVAEAEAVVEALQVGVLDRLSPARQAALLDALTTLISGPLSTPAACSRPVRRRAPRS
jgi:MarR family transcriptional regulator for hemolysin